MHVNNAAVSVQLGAAPRGSFGTAPTSGGTGTAEVATAAEEETAEALLSAEAGEEGVVVVAAAEDA